jgi:hypothetical protein
MMLDLARPRRGSSHGATIPTGTDFMYSQTPGHPGFGRYDRSWSTHLNNRSTEVNS